MKSGAEKFRTSFLSTERLHNIYISVTPIEKFVIICYNMLYSQNYGGVLMDFLTSMPAFMLCAVSAGILTLSVFVFFLISHNERKHAWQYWNRISGFMELSENNISYPLECDEILIGRHASADIRLPDLSVSRYHAILTVADGTWTITDIGSKSGVFVNGNLVKQRILRENDVINLGSRRLVFRRRRNNDNVH